MKKRIERIIRLYRAMPGAPMPAIEDGVFMWGEVDGTEQWAFCEAIVDMIDAAVAEAKGDAA